MWKKDEPLLRLLKDRKSLEKTLTLRRAYYIAIQYKHQKLTKNSYNTFMKKMIRWRKTGIIPYDFFTDRRRYCLNWFMAFDNEKQAIEWVKGEWRVRIRRTRKVELWIEKDTLIDTFHNICYEQQIPMYSSAGFTSITWKNKVMERNPDIILYVGDYDAEGFHIPRKIKEWLPKTKFIRLAMIRKDMNRYKELGINMVKPANLKRQLKKEYVRKYHSKHGNRKWEIEILSNKELIKRFRSHGKY